MARIHDFVGADVHAGTIAVAVGRKGQPIEVAWYDLPIGRSCATASVQLGKLTELQVAYEAGPTVCPLLQRRSLACSAK